MSKSLGDLLREMDAKATKGPWTLATQVEFGEHGRVPIGIVSGCSVEHDHCCDDEESACVVTEFARVHLNDSRKPPLHPDNAKEMQTARAVVTLRNALPLLAAALDAADAMKEWVPRAADYTGRGKSVLAYDAARAALAEALKEGR